MEQAQPGTAIALRSKPGPIVAEPRSRAATVHVSIATPGPFHTAYLWAAYLEQRAMLNAIVTPMPRRWVARYDLSPTHVRSVPIVKVMDHLVGRYAPQAVQQRNQLVSSTVLDLVASRCVADSDVLNGWCGVSLRSFRLARRTGVRTVLQTGSAHIVHQGDILRAEYQKWGPDAPLTHPAVMRRVLREYELADAVVVPSEFVYKSFLEHGLPHEKLFLVPWAVLPVAEPPERHQPDRDVRVLFVGALTLRKGIPYLLDAAGRLDRGARVRLVGGVNQPLLRRLEVPANVEVVGHKRGEALAEEFRQAEIFVLPSVEDGSAYVILEAMLAGLPVIVSDQAGPALIEDGVQGFVVPAGDSQTLAERLLLLIRDESRRREMGDAARQVAAARTPEVYGSELSTLVYEPLLSRGDATAG